MAVTSVYAERKQVKEKIAKDVAAIARTPLLIDLGRVVRAARNLDDAIARGTPDEVLLVVAESLTAAAESLARVGRSQAYAAASR